MSARPARRTARLLRRAFVSGAVWLAGCGGEEPAVPPLPAQARAALEQAGEGPVEGSIAGSPWHAEDVRWRVIERPGRERVDLLLWDDAIERCGLPLERRGTAVWLRFAGVTSLEPGAYELDAQGGPFEVHYEHPTDDGLTTTHRGVASVRIDAVEPRSVRGQLRICFADEAESCVGGRFDARPCWSRIDGRTLREPPGLADEALEPIPEAP